MKRIFTKDVPGEREVHREDETALPTSPKKPGASGNLVLPELTELNVRKFFVGIRKVG